LLPDPRTTIDDESTAAGQRAWDEPAGSRDASFESHEEIRETVTKLELFLFVGLIFLLLIVIACFVRFFVNVVMTTSKYAMQWIAMYIIVTTVSNFVDLSVVQQFYSMVIEREEWNVFVRLLGIIGNTTNTR
jgi:hypothetical protein